jgi:hypothetical protein
LLVGRRIVIVGLVWLGSPLDEQVLFVVMQVNIQRLDAVKVQSTILAVVVLLHTAMCHSYGLEFLHQGAPSYMLQKYLYPLSQRISNNDSSLQ